MSPESNLAWQVAQMQTKVDKHHKDLYEGGGMDDPSITTRLDRQEKAMEERKQKEATIRAYMMTGFFLVLATFLTLLGNLIMGHKL